MKKKAISIIYALLASIMFTTSALAGGSIKLSNVTFDLGSLIANGTLTGLGRTDVTVVLDATGDPIVTCVNNGGNTVPGQSAPRVSASGQQALLGDSPLRKNGRSPFGVETEDPETIPWNEAGCPNATWIGRLDFILWTDAVISVYDTATGALLLEQHYTCTTTRFPASVSCTAVE